MEDTEVVYEVAVVRGVKIPTRDPEVHLNADLHLPVGEESFAAVLTVLPYRSDGFGGIGAGFTSQWLAERGIASLFVDFRGIGLSGGDRRAPFDRDEADDAEDAIAWLAEQTWCSGRIGMWGSSYGGVMSLRTAARRPAHLCAIVPLMAMADPERDFIHPAGGRGALAPLGAWGMTTLIDWILPPLNEPLTLVSAAQWADRLQNTEPWVLDLWNNRPGSPVWRDRAVDVGQVNVPALFVSGWRDLFVDGSLAAYAAVPSEKALIAGPWMHTPPDFSPFHTVEFLPELLAWWRRWLIDEAPQAHGEHPVRAYVENFGWTTFDTWPPVATNRESAFHSDRPVPVKGTADAGALSGLHSIPTSGFGLPLDQHDDDVRGLIFDQPTDRDVVIAGSPSLHLSAVTPGARLTVKLADVHPDGTSTLICSGAGRAVAAELTVTLEPIAFRVPAGHTIRVVVSTSDFPRLFSEGLEPGGRGGYRLTLPVVELAGEPTAPFPLTQLPFASPPGWELSRTTVEPGTTVSIPQAFAGIPFSEHASVAWDQAIEMTVTAGEPEAARVTGRADIGVHYSNGSTASVRAAIEAAPQSLTVQANFTVDGTTLFERRWQRGSEDSAGPAGE